MIRFAAFVLAAGGLLLPTALAQQMEFEVASVKINKDNGPSDMRGPRRSGESVIMHNAQISSVIFYAYHLNGNYQLAGYRADPSDDSYWVDIEARAPANATDDQIRLMFQSLLEDRFKLKIHHETREILEYELTVRGKPKLASAREGDMTVTVEGRTFPARAGACSTTLWKEGNHIVCHAAGIETITTQLGGLLQAPLTDGTGLKGKYDFDLLYLPDNRKLEADAPPAPSLIDAVQESLGLKLEKVKGPVDVLVIDHLERPSGN